MTHGRKRHRGKVALALLAGALAIGLVLWFVVIPYPWTQSTSNPERTALMEQRLAEAREAGTPLEIRQEWTPLEEISPTLVRAVIVAEDYRFRLHEGVDWVSLAEEVRWTGDDSFSWLSPSDLGALRRALAYAWANRHDLRGRSTITQQLAKNLYFGTDRTLARKAMELVVAGRLERRLGKDRILELYLNVVEWGPGVFGAEAASRRYFGRSAASLSLDQAAALAATLPHPLTSNPAHRPSRMLWRKDLILQRLDPTSGIPAAPLPLPEPEIDIGIEPGLEIEPGLDVPATEPPDSAPR
jgi:monofunctional biosynthetic peptidoglycan transglycosylase